MSSLLVWLFNGLILWSYLKLSALSLVWTFSVLILFVLERNKTVNVKYGDSAWFCLFRRLLLCIRVLIYHQGKVRISIIKSWCQNGQPVNGFVLERLFVLERNKTVNVKYGDSAWFCLFRRLLLCISVLIYHQGKVRISIIKSWRQEGHPVNGNIHNCRQK